MNSDRLYASRRQVLAAFAALSIQPARSQPRYPTKPVTVIVPFAAGGTTDILGRLVSQKLSIKLGTPFIVDNRTGAGGSVGANLVARAASDGYMLLCGTVGTHAINQYLYKKLAYDPFKDFSPIALIATVPNVLVANKAQPFNSVKELIAYSKQNPKKITYASAGNGTSIHLAGAMFEQMAGIEMVHIPYRGSAPAISDLLSGQTNCMFDNLPSSIQHIRSGSLKAIAVTSAKRFATLPDVPTVAESGMPGYDATSWFGLWGPANMPPALVEMLNEELQQILGQPDVKRSMLEQGADASLSTPAQFQSFIHTEANKWSKVVIAANVHLD